MLNVDDDEKEFHNGKIDNVDDGKIDNVDNGKIDNVDIGIIIDNGYVQML